MLATILSAAVGSPIYITLIAKDLGLLILILREGGLNMYIMEPRYVETEEPSSAPKSSILGNPRKPRAIAGIIMAPEEALTSEQIVGVRASSLAL